MDINDFKTANGQPAVYVEDCRPEGGVPLLKFPLLQKTGVVEHGFTTRVGGASSGIFSTLNLSYIRGDQKSAVDENFRRVAVSIGAQVSDFVLTDQTHTAVIRLATKADRGKGVIKERDYHDVDGLVTDEPGLVLSAFFADCVPLFFVDPIHRAAGLSHSGWRGTIARIGQATVQAMGQAFGSRPEDIYCAIGPSICQSCYEVSEELAIRFQEEFPAGGQELCRPQQKQQAQQQAAKYQLNLWKANEIVLKEAGIQPSHLAVANICTSCNSNLLFSHRASHGKRGNLGAFIKLQY